MRLRKSGSAAGFISLLIIIRNPLVILLAVLSSISFATGDPRAGSVMAGMIVLSVTLRFLQEARAGAAAAKLKAMIHVTATVVAMASREIPLRDLVPGDIINLSAGDMIPGDVRILSAKDLFVSQGTLTGESLPVEKFHDADPKPQIPPSNSRTCASWVPAFKAAQRPRSWSLREFTPISAPWPVPSLQEGTPTSFDQGLSRFTWLMIQLMAVMVPLVFLINGFTKHDWKGAFFFAMAVAVGPDSGDAAHDCLRLPRQGRTRHEPQESDRQASQRHSELRRNGCSLHR
jgi:Mg2+-importing ATPase